jgi:hypothetical protein
MNPTRNVVLLAALCAAVSVAATDGEFDKPAEEPAAASLPPELASGPNFHVKDPVAVDGLMHHYVIESKFGVFPAYGRDALTVRVREVAALTQISKTTDIDVVAKTVETRVKSDAKTLGQALGNPIGTVVGIPRGIGHLFNGYKAQANEMSDTVKHDATTITSGGATASHVASTAKSDATRYADRYLGISSAERAYYQQFGVDPYTSNEVLRKAIHRLARVNAVVNVGMHFVGVPGVPYLGDVRRAMDAIYTEDPAVLRARQRATLAGYGLSAEEIKRYQNTLLLSPTRQKILDEIAKSLDGVAGRDELFRHALSVTSEEEVEVFLRSAGMLARLHARRPVAKILAGLRLPTAQYGDGRIVVLGAFDAVSWTEDVAGYESALHAALPPDGKGLELWLSGPASALAKSELTARGWDVHDNATETLSEEHGTS